jgi:hypothetical protein
MFPQIYFTKKKTLVHDAELQRENVHLFSLPYFQYFLAKRDSAPLQTNLEANGQLPTVAIEWIALLLRTSDISVPELVLETIYPDRFRFLFQVNTVTVPQRA